jgi:hypothetical protein
MGLVDPLHHEPTFVVPREILRYFAVWYVCYLCGERTASLTGALVHTDIAHGIDMTARNVPETEL